MYFYGCSDLRFFMDTKATPTIITTSFIGQQGQMLFYMPLYGNRGALSGILRVDPAVLNALAGLFDGSFTITGATITANRVAPFYGQTVSTSPKLSGRVTFTAP